MTHTDYTKAQNLGGNFLRLFNQQAVAYDPAGQPIYQQPPGNPPVLQVAPAPAAVPQQHLQAAPVTQPVTAPPQQFTAVPPASQPVAQLAQYSPQVTPPLLGAVTPPSDSGRQVLLEQNQAMRTQLQEMQVQQVQQQEQQRQQQIQALPNKQDQIIARLEMLDQREKQATKRAVEWQVDSKRNEIIYQHSGEIDQRVLDTSSVESLYASVPAAKQAYEQMESNMFSKFRRTMGIQDQSYIEGLPQSPNAGLSPAQGMPSPNRAGAVVSVPGPTAGPPMMHPQLSRDNVYGQGRVYQTQGLPAPQPNAQNQYFPPQYHMPGGPATMPQQPQVMYAPMPGGSPQAVLAVQQQQQQQQQAAQFPMGTSFPQGNPGMPVGTGLAPLPDPQMAASAASGMPGRGLLPMEAIDARNAATASISSSRRAGPAGVSAHGFQENPSLTTALSGGAQPLLQQPPVVNNGYGSQAQHPQYLAGA